MQDAHAVPGFWSLFNKYNGQWKMDEDLNGNRKLFWKEVNNAKGRMVESCSRIKDGNGRLAMGEDQVLRI